MRRLGEANGGGFEWEKTEWGDWSTEESGLGVRLLFKIVLDFGPANNFVDICYFNNFILMHKKRNNNGSEK